MIKKIMKRNTRLWEAHKSIKFKIKTSVPLEIRSFIRRQRPVTKLFGETYCRSRKLIEIDITYDCNLKCFNCDRSCSQAPSNEQMSVNQIRKFVKESIKSNVRWKRIRVLGGEPTLHHELIKILNILIDYKKIYSPFSLIQLVTNGFGKTVNNVLANVPDGIEIVNTSKKSRIQLFDPFNIAPKDLIFWRYSDYSSGCSNSVYSGIGLTRYGYYPCAAAGGIDRVFGFNCGINKLPSPADSMRDLYNIFCPNCGHFRNTKPINRGIISPTWKIAYGNYKKNKPNLSLY